MLFANSSTRNVDAGFCAHRCSRVSSSVDVGGGVRLSESPLIAEARSCCRLRWPWLQHDLSFSTCGCFVRAPFTHIHDCCYWSDMLGWTWFEFICDYANIMPFFPFQRACQNLTKIDNNTSMAVWWSLGRHTMAESQLQGLPSKFRSSERERDWPKYDMHTRRICELYWRQ